MRKIKTKNKRGISPVIATVLLIAIVVVIALILFLWFRGIMKENITKFGEAIDLVCEKTNIEASYSSGAIQLRNNGNTAIYDIKLKEVSSGSHHTEDIRNIDVNFNGLGSGETYSLVYSVDPDVEEITFIPILIGNSEAGDKAYVCDERTGYVLKL